MRAQPDIEAQGRKVLAASLRVSFCDEWKRACELGLAMSEEKPIGLLEQSVRKNSNIQTTQKKALREPNDKNLDVLRRNH